MKQLRFYTQQVVWQEVPNETSLAFLITGCPLGCKGCHSAESWKVGSGQILSEIYLANSSKNIAISSVAYCLWEENGILSSYLLG